MMMGGIGRLHLLVLMMMEAVYQEKENWTLGVTLDQLDRRSAFRICRLLELWWGCRHKPTSVEEATDHFGGSVMTQTLTILTHSTTILKIVVFWVDLRSSRVQLHEVIIVLLS